MMDLNVQPRSANFLRRQLLTQTETDIEIQAASYNSSNTTCQTTDLNPIQVKLPQVQPVSGQEDNELWLLTSLAICNMSR